jgi:hypothetical protein
LGFGRAEKDGGGGHAHDGLGCFSAVEFLHLASALETDHDLDLVFSGAREGRL